MLPSALMAVWWGASTGSWQFALMSLSSLALSAFAQRWRGGDSNKVDELAHFETGWDGSRWHVGTRTLARQQWLWRPRERRRVYAELIAIAQSNSAALALSARRESGFAASAAEPLALWLGQTAAGADLELSLARDGPHCILVGPTGSGKSRLLTLMATSLATSGRAEWRLFDFKGGAALAPVAEFLGRRGEQCELSSDLDLAAAERACDDLLHTIDGRERLLASVGAADYLAFNGSNARRRKLAPVLVLVDEFAALLRAVSIAPATFEAVATRGRTLGVHLIATNQTCSGIGRTMLANIRQRVVFAGIDSVDAVQLGFGSTPQLGQARAGWAAAAIHDNAARFSTAFSFPLDLSENLAQLGVHEAVGNGDGLAHDEPVVRVDAEG